MIRIKLEYYRQSGKWYGQGQTSCPDGTPHFEVMRSIREKLNTQSLPGLVEDHGLFIVHVLMIRATPTGPQQDQPHLVIPEEWQT